MPDIVISEFMDAAVAATLVRDDGARYEPRLFQRPDELRALLAEARGLIVRNRVTVDAGLLDAAPRLLAVGRLGVGLDNIDLPACAERNVTVCPSTGGNHETVAEYSIAGMIQLMRHGAFQASDRVLAGDWPRGSLIGHDLFGRQLGIVGFGAIGRAVARRAAALGLRVVATDPYVPDFEPAWGALNTRRVSLEDLLAESDVVSLHCPLTRETRNLLDANRLAAMKPGAKVINAARGGIVDEAALATALVDGRLGGALIDVFADEPLPADSLLVGVPNLILTPHIAGVTEESNRRISEITAANVRRVLAERG